MRDFFRRLFNDCSACKARDEHIADLKAQLESLRQDRDKIQEKLFQALRLGEPVPKTESQKVSVKSWPQIQQSLEKKFSTPESKRAHDYWTRKVEENAGDLSEAVRSDASSAGREGEGAVT